MAVQPTDPLRRFIHQLVETQQREQLSDRELLQLFAAERDEAAFTTLVRRHGQLVLRICRRVLGNREDAEDACQAAFLVLARKAASRRWQASVGNWLFKVAYRLARAARAETLRRRACESRVEPRCAADPATQLTLHDAGEALDEELLRLPEALRLPVILYYLEGRKRAQAAQQLGCSTATLDRRLERALELLRSRLARRGVTLSTVLLTAGQASDAWAIGSGLLVGPTVRAAVAFATRQGELKTNISIQAAAWAEGVLHAMVLTKVKLGAVLLAVTLMVGTVSALVCQRLVGSASGKVSPAGRFARTKTLAPSEQKKAVSVDVYGDPLPERALNRLGTVRWRHGAGIHFVAVLPDGKSVLTASQDRTARLWDLATGKQRYCFGIDVPAPGKGGIIERPLLAVFSNPSNVLATSGDGVVIRLHDVATGKERESLRGPAAGFGALAFSPDGQCLAAAEPNGIVHVWETATGRALRRLDAKPLKTGSAAKRDTLAFTADGKTLLWAGTANQLEVKPTPTTIKVWDFASGKELRQFTVSGRITARPAFSLDGKTLAWASIDEADGERKAGKYIHLFNTVTRKEMRQLFISSEYNNPVPASLAFSPDGKVLAVQDEHDQSVELWEVDTGKPRWQIGTRLRYGAWCPLFHVSIPASSLNFSADGKLLALGGGHNTVHVLDVVTGKELHAVGGHQAAVVMVRFGSDDKTLFTQGEDDTIRRWDILTRKETGQIKRKEGKTIFTVLSQDGRIAAARETDDVCALRLWDTVTGKDIRRIRVNSQIGWYALSPDGKWLTIHIQICNQGDHRNFLFDVATGKEIPLTEELDEGVETFFDRKSAGSLFSPDGQILTLEAYSHGKGQLRLWDLARSDLRTLLEIPEKGSIQAMAFSPDGRSLALDLGNDELTVWEMATGKERCHWKKKPLNAQLVAGILGHVVHPLYSPWPLVSKLAFSPDSKILVEGCADRTIGVWDVAAGKELGILRGHAGEVQTVAFAPDGKTLASGSVDTTVLLWDMTRWTHGKKTPARDLSDRELESYWANLEGADATQAFKSLVALASAPGQAIPFLKKHLQPIVAADAQRVQRLIGELDSNSFVVRQKAGKALEREGEAALALLHQALKDKPSLETRRYLQTLLAKLTGWPVSGERLRHLRAVEALERMDTAEAKQLLRTLAQGLPEATLTREAQAALKRLGR